MADGNPEGRNLIFKKETTWFSNDRVEDEKLQKELVFNFTVEFFIKYRFNSDTTEEEVNSPEIQSFLRESIRKYYASKFLHHIDQSTFEDSVSNAVNIFAKNLIRDVQKLKIFYENFLEKFVLARKLLLALDVPEILTSQLKPVEPRVIETIIAFDLYIKGYLRWSEEELISFIQSFRFKKTTLTTLVTIFNRKYNGKVIREFLGDLQGGSSVSFFPEGALTTKQKGDYLSGRDGVDGGKLDPESQLRYNLLFDSVLNIANGEFKRSTRFLGSEKIQSNTLGNGERSKTTSNVLTSYLFPKNFLEEASYDSDLFKFEEVRRRVELIKVFETEYYSIMKVSQPLAEISSFSKEHALNVFGKFLDELFSPRGRSEFNSLNLLFQSNDIDVYKKIRLLMFSFVYYNQAQQSNFSSKLSRVIEDVDLGIYGITSDFLEQIKVKGKQGLNTRSLLEKYCGDNIRNKYFFINPILEMKHERHIEGRIKKIKVDSKLITNLRFNSLQGEFIKNLLDDFAENYEGAIINSVEYRQADLEEKARLIISKFRSQYLVVDTRDL